MGRDFSWALVELRRGGRLTRAGLQADGIWLVLRPDGVVYVCRGDSSEKPWVPTQGDVLAGDWQFFSDWMV